MTANASVAEGQPVYSFTTQNAGQCPGTATGNMPSSPAVSLVSINGSTDLSNVIVGPSGAYVKTIGYRLFDGIARSGELIVDGQGPMGMGSGSLKITVTTANGTHDLSLTSSKFGEHTDKFADNAPITQIVWEHT
ncbi:hypothetical protein A7982_14019 [Minicystis rosea]|nr:hypothetical protein A7982_14019 [Minicystis rosea]